MIRVAFPVYSAVLDELGRWRVDESELPEMRESLELELNQLYPPGSRPDDQHYYPHELVAQAKAAADGLGGQIVESTLPESDVDAVF